MRRREPLPDGGALPPDGERSPDPAEAGAVAGREAVVVEALGLVERGLDLLAGVDASTLPEGCVADTVRRLSRADGRIDGIQAGLVRAAEAAGLPERTGASSTAGWYADTTRRSYGQAARTDRLAKAADTNPRLAEEVATGRVGPDHAATIAAGLDRGTIDPADAEDLLDNATHLPPGAFTREVKRTAGRRHQQRLRQDEKAAHDARFLDTRRLDDGSLAISGQFAPGVGDVVTTMLEAFTTPDGAEVPDEHRRTSRQRRADGLVAAARAALAAGAAGDVGGVRPHVSVVVPLEAMAALRDAEAAGAIATTATGTVLSAAAFKALACDATVRRVAVDADGMPLDVGRATRKWSGAIRAAIVAADGSCRGPCCDGLPPSRCIIHHVRFWEAGGETSVANGVLLCDRGHDLVHVEGWTLEMDPATRVCTWTSPEGHVATTRPDGPATHATTAPPPTVDVRDENRTDADAEVAPRADRRVDRPPRPDDVTELQFDLGP